MKTFKQHMKEDISPLGVGTPEVQAVEDGSIGVHNIHEPEVLKKVNGFVGSINSQTYLNATTAINQLKGKLHAAAGLDIGDINLEGKNGSVSVPVTQFGGAYGKTTENAPDEVTNDDGISTRKPGGLKMNIKYETLEDGQVRIQAELV